MMFWKNWFRKEEVKENVNFFELSKWLIENIDVMKNLDKDVVELREILNNLKERSKILEKVDISNKKVEKRLKTMVEGNRPAYIRNLKLLMKKINVPETYDSKTVASFVEDVEDELKNFNKRTIRNYHIIQNLIGDELVAVVESIKKIDIVNKRIKENTCRGQLADLERVQVGLEDIYNYLDSKDNEKKQIESLVKERETLREHEIKLKGIIEKNKKGNDFIELAKLKAIRDTLVQDEYEIRSLIDGSFGVLSRALRKLDKIDSLKIIKSYIENPYETFMKDDDLKINLVLSSLNSALDSNKITIKNTDKVKSVLKNFSKDNVKNYKNKLDIIVAELSKIEDKISINNFEEKELKLKRDMEALIQEMGNIEEKISNFKKRDITKEIDDIKKGLRGLSVKIKLQNVPVD